MSKQRKIYINNLNLWVDVNEEQYLGYYRPIWKTQKQMQRSKKCMCLKKDLWKCDGICIDCSYYVRECLSLNFEEELHGDNLINPNANVEDITSDKSILNLLLKRLEEIYPDGKEIGMLKMQGFTEREIAEKIKTPRKTFIYRLDKAKKILFEEFGEEIKKFF